MNAKTLWLCECSRVNCFERIEISLELWEKIHDEAEEAGFSPYFILPDHAETGNVVVMKTDTYWVVKRAKTPTS